jgi:hypothetical protein
MGRIPMRVTKKASAVTVDHLLPGISDGERQVPPQISWAGTGGYWCRVDVNDILQANVANTVNEK